MITIEKIMSKPIFMAKDDVTVNEVVKIMVEKNRQPDYWQRQGNNWYNCGTRPGEKDAL